jgi:hypothetical protein
MRRRPTSGYHRRPGFFLEPNCPERTMAKPREPTRKGWRRTTGAGSRPEVDRASGGKEKVEGRPPQHNMGLGRMGPYEMSYQIDLGYRGRENI